MKVGNGELTRSDRKRAIPSPTNEQVDKVNNLILSKIDALTQIYYSVDTVPDLEEALHFPTEFFNSLNPSGLPPYKMVLKISLAMTINKSQRQTFNVAGLNLSVECFSHGRLFVALSRVTSKESM
ncbi:uncharacterized protein LOC132951352 [Metopolophium dirhodum]|uniref:uncharacterized protein LOC132951352 n=1 Tax=Metopolophium dirhodum TaxID=44670 RepID=UPI00298F40F0|nr:uncharacterized protein LOC132951352 [Metopolophium dirhodum]